MFSFMGDSVPNITLESSAELTQMDVIPEDTLILQAIQSTDYQRPQLNIHKAPKTPLYKIKQ
jgi:hypothetical protein